MVQTGLVPQDLKTVPTKYERFCSRLGPFALTYRKANTFIKIIKLLGKMSLYDEAFPEYLKLNLHQVSAYNLRSLIAPVLMPKDF